jgi:mannose-6-phosphate isomerase-like protein (cupin superfamily)
MKRIIWALALCVSGLGLQAQAGDKKVAFVDHDKVAKAGTLVTEPNLVISINSRTGPGQVEVHDKETDTMYVLSGAATVVIGGEGVDMKPSGAGQSRGTSIKGGETFQLTKGDVLVVPNKTPHWFKEVSSPIQYYLIKVLEP